MESKKINVELTVAPETLHAGFFIALSKGYYKEEGVDVKLSWPKTEEETARDYIKRGINELCDKRADVAIGFVPTIVKYNTYEKQQQQVPLVALASICKKNGTGIAVLKNKKIESPKDLDNKKCALFGLDYEEGIIREMVKRDGGRGDIDPIVPAFKDILSGLKTSKWDAAHICIPWHGVLAKREGIDIHTFGPLENYGIPRDYPVIMSLRDTVSGPKKEALRSFLKATARGYHDMITEDPKLVAKLLCDNVSHPNMRDVAFLEDSIRSLSTYFRKQRWGFMKDNVWSNYVHFLSENRLLIDEEGRPIREEHVRVQSFFTNELLPSI